MYTRARASCRRALFRAWSCSSAGAVLLWASAALPGIARAELVTQIAGVGTWQYNSNVYDVQAGFPIPGTCLSVPFHPSILACPSSAYRYGDSYYSYGAQATLNETYSQQTWFLSGSLTRFDYDRFTQLTHNEYRLDGGWNWRLGDNWDGRLEVLRTRTMVAFTEIVQLELAVAIEQREAASIGYQFTPDWRVEASGFTHKVGEPLLGEPNLQLSESSGTVDAKYGGPSALVGGVAVSYSHGSYTGVTAVPGAIPFFAYDQTTAGLTASYRPSTTTAALLSGVSTFDGAVGWSQRTSPSNQSNLTGITGHLDYTNQVTGKTSVTLALDRAINSYLTNAASEIDSTAALRATWQATYRIAVAPAYSWIYRFLPLQGSTPGTNRGDHLQFASLAVNWVPRPWLTIKPYANYQTRKTNFYGGNFNATVYGVSVTVAWQHPPAIE